MKKIITIVLCAVLITVLASCGAEEESSRAVSLQVSDRNVDVKYMLGTDLTVFGAESPRELDEGAELRLEFTESEPFESDDRLFIVSGKGLLSMYGQQYSFTIEDELMSKVEVSQSNTVCESILTSSITVDDKPVEISIDFVAAEDFSQAVATVSAEGGMLFFGDIFNDYLEYFNMVLAGVL